MANYRVVLEIEVEADDELNAAKTVQEWLDDGDNNWQFYVQKSSKDDDEVFSVDLANDDDDAVNEVDNYIPLIK